MRTQAMAAIASCLCSIPTLGVAAPCAGIFTDVDSAASYCPAVAFIKDKGVTAGCTGTTYCPNDYVTRAQMALFMQRLARGAPDNVLEDATDSIGGGAHNTAAGGYASIGGGDSNQATKENATVAGGSANESRGEFAAVGGGTNNTASGFASTVPGGIGNVAAGDYSVALGRTATVNANGAFSFADGTGYEFDTNVDNTFRVRATGGVRFVVGIDNLGNTTWSCLLTDGSSWSCSSDRNQKQDLVELDGGAVLAKLAAMPIYAWSPKGAYSYVRHYGPMAQDFHAAFELGDSDIMIGQQDADGVALAAIKGLNQKLDVERAQNAALRSENAEFRSRLDAIERAIVR